MTVPQEVALRTIAMPADANPSGDIFGGWLLSQMDMAGGSAAVQRAGGRVVTVAMDAIVFHLPVEVGDELSCYATVRRVGRTSITVDVAAWKRHPAATERIKVTEGVFTYVKIDENRRPIPVPRDSSKPESV
jgi:acyl-CoA thioesterase YciA